MTKPTVFISSTIYDFRDLRSSLKFYLEEKGFKVLASEFNDFQKSLEKHSYEACLEAVRSADYFILLIGSRVGGWYDAQQRVSITQREYQEAYECHKQGKIKILSFVRTEVWQAKEDRMALRRHLATTNLEKEVQNSIANHESKSLQDAQFIAGFISEISRNAETKLAIQGGGMAPSGNWVHQFGNFRDIVDVLNTQIRSSIAVEDLAARSLLRNELMEFVGQTTLKLSTKGSLLSPRSYVELFHQRSGVTIAALTNPTHRVGLDDWNKLSTVAVAIFGCQLRPVVLAQMLTQSTFLMFDLRSGTYHRTEVYDALVKLQNEIISFNQANKPSLRPLIFNNTRSVRASGGQHVDVETMGLVEILGLIDRWLNILEISVSVIRFLDGAAFPRLELRPETPVQGMQQELDQEKPTNEEISEFIAGHKNYERSGWD